MTNNVMIILLGSLDEDIDEGGKFTLVDLAIPVIWFFSLSTFSVSVLLLFAVINVSFVISFFVFSFRPVLKSNFLVPQQETKMQKKQNDKTSQELRMLSPSLCIQRSQCNCSYCCSQLSEM